MRFNYEGDYTETLIGDLIIQKGKRAKGRELEYKAYSINNQTGFSVQEEQWGDASYTKLEKNGYKVIENNDLAYNPARINVGSVGLYKEQTPCIVSSLYVCFATKPKLIPDYLFKYLKSEKFNKKVLSTQEGGVRTYFFYDKLQKTKMFIPTLSEQKKVNDFLNCINERIDTQNKIIEKYESLIKPLFETLNSNANIDIAIKELGPYVSADLLSWNDMIDAGEPAIIYGQLFTDYKYIIEKVISKTERRIKTKTKDNDLLFPSSTTVDSLSLIAPSSIKIPGVIIGGDMFKIELDKDKFDSDYMSFLINCSLNKRIAKYAQGSTIIHLHYEDIKLFRMKICDIKKQKEISKQMKVLLEKISVERSVIELLQKQKKYFLDNLFI